MDKLTNAQRELWEMDDMAAGSSAIHRLHPLTKLLATIAYVFLVVSFPKYDLSGLVGMVLYPVVLYQIAGIPVSACFYKLRVVLPLVCAVGLVNPFMDRSVLLYLGSVPITGGVVSMVTLMLKGIYSLMASFLLIATTPIDAICAALGKLHVPGVLTTLLLLTYRYIGLMIREVAVMSESYALRAPGQKGIHISAWGSFLGQLLLRSMDRGAELYNSMLLRGFTGSFYYVGVPRAGKGDALFCLGSALFFLAAKAGNLAELLGNLILR